MLIFPDRFFLKFYKYFVSSLFFLYFKEVNSSCCIFFFHPFPALDIGTLYIFNIPIFLCKPGFHFPSLSDFFSGRFFLFPVPCFSNLNSPLYFNVISLLEKYKVVSYVLVNNYLFPISFFFYSWDIFFFFKDNLYMYIFNYLFLFHNFFHNFFFSVYANIKSITEAVFY